MQRYKSRGDNKSYLRNDNSCQEDTKKVGQSTILKVSIFSKQFLSSFYNLLQVERSQTQSYISGLFRCRQLNSHENVG